MLLNLIAIDPGGETGIAWSAFRPDGYKRSSDKKVIASFKHNMGEAIQIHGTPNEQAQVVVDYVQERRLKTGAGKTDSYNVRTVVIMEDFIPPASRARTKDVLLPVIIAAKVEYHLWYENLDVEFVWQQPGERTGITPDMLRNWGLWQPGKANDDAMAALQHLLTYARKEEKRG